MKSPYMVLIATLSLLFCLNGCSIDSSQLDEYYDEGYTVGYDAGLEDGQRKAWEEIEKVFEEYSCEDFQELSLYFTNCTLYSDDDLHEILLYRAFPYGYLIGFGDALLGNDPYYSSSPLNNYPEYENYFDHNIDEIKRVLPH